MKIHKNQNDDAPPSSDVLNSPEELKKELDRILDKINHSGYQGLTKKEKDFLKKFGDMLDKDNN